MNASFVASSRRLVRAVLVCCAGLLVLSLLAANAFTPPAPAADPAVTVLSQGAPNTERRSDLPSLHADGALPDLQDLCGDVQAPAVATSFAWATASVGPIVGEDRRIADVGIPLPERPPRA